MHSTACGVGATSTGNSAASMQPAADGLKMVHNNDDAMNKIPLKSASGGPDDDEKNGGEFINDTAAAEEARREHMRANILKWMKKLTIVLICFIGLALISYVIISLCFSEWPKSTNAPTSAQSPSPSSASTSASTSSSSPSPTASASSNSSLSPDGSSSSSNNNNKVPLNSSTSPSDADMRRNNAAAAAAAAASLGFMDGHSAEIATTGGNPPPTAATSGGGGGGSRVGNSTSVSAAEKPRLQASTLLQDVLSVVPKFESKMGVYEHAAVCSDREVCSQIGSKILQEEGSAVDATIATLLCNGIVNMHSMGIGGGALMNVYIKDSRQAYTIDAREVAPFATTPEMFETDEELSLHGAQAIAVPGELMGYHRAHERFGKLPWKTLVEPSIKLCKEGFYLGHHQWNALLYKFPHWKNNTVLTNVFMNNSTGQMHPIGTKLQPQKELCDTYAMLAENGPLDFYNGTLAKLVIEDLKELGSSMALYDLESYSADFVGSITMQLGNDTLYAAPPVSSGTVVANILSILEGYNFTAADMKGAENEARTMHRFVEAMKFGFAKRWELGDLRFNDVRELVSKLTNPEYGIELRGKINDTTVLKAIYDYGAQFSGEDDVGTSHVSIVAPNGDAVSVTSSVNDYFGCGQAGRRTGIIFNSGMNDFTIPGKLNAFGLPAAPSNYIDAHKRSMSSMSPMILTQPNGDLRMAFGAAGGAKIISAVVEVAARVIWFGQDIKQAIDAPRFHHQLVPNVLFYENERFSEEVIKLLQARGHETKSFKDNGSVVCGIVRNETALYANADFRKRGGVAGY